MNLDLNILESKKKESKYFTGVDESFNIYVMMEDVKSKL